MYNGFTPPKTCLNMFLTVRAGQRHKQTNRREAAAARQQVNHTFSGQFIRYTHLVPCRTPLCFQNSLNSLGAWKRLSIGIKGPNVCQENMTPPPVPLTPGRMGPWTHAADAKT